MTTKEAGEDKDQADHHDQRRRRPTGRRTSRILKRKGSASTVPESAAERARSSLCFWASSFQVLVVGRGRRFRASPSCARRRDRFRSRPRNRMSGFRARFDDRCVREGIVSSRNFATAESTATTVATAPSSGNSRLKCRCDNFGHPHAEVVIQHQDFAPCDQSTIHQNVDGVAGQFVQRHDRPGLQLQNFLDQQLGASQFDPQVEFDACRAWRPTPSPPEPTAP